MPGSLYAKCVMWNLMGFILRVYATPDSIKIAMRWAPLSAHGTEARKRHDEMALCIENRRVRTEEERWRGIDNRTSDPLHGDSSGYFSRPPFGGYFLQCREATRPKGRPSFKLKSPGVVVLQGVTRRRFSTQCRPRRSRVHYQYFLYLQVFDFAPT